VTIVAQGVELVSKGLIEAALGARIRSLDSWPHPYSTSHSLIAIDVELEDGQMLKAVVKQMCKRRTIGPAFVHRSDRELETYRTLLSDSLVQAPRLLGATKSHLVLERVAGIPMWESDYAGAAGAAAAATRTLHDELADRANAPFLLRYDRSFYARWRRRACLVDPGLKPFAKMHELAADRLLEERQVVIHGELYPSNVLVSRGTVSIIDWETTAVGPAVIDLVALTSGWSQSHEQAVLSAYGRVDSIALDCARLQLAFQWISWSARWTPPSAHAQDWRSEAAHAADRLHGRLA
jgi:aminoglycoside phosphotransferase (APT) family kinase protein